MASRVSSSLLLAGGYPSHLIAYDLSEYQSILLVLLHPESRQQSQVTQANAALERAAKRRIRLFPVCAGA
jgi:hypothetical protein